MCIERNFEHSCGCMLTNKKTARGVGAAWIGRNAAGLLKDCPNARPKNIQQHIVRTLGVHTTSYRTAHHRGKKRQHDLEICEEMKSFQLIEPYFQKLKTYMPGTVAILERDSSNRLLRTFVMLKPMIDAFKHGMPVLSVDACHLKNSFKGCLMVATMIDGLKQTQLLACMGHGSRH